MFPYAKQAAITKKETSFRISNTGRLANRPAMTSFLVSIDILEFIASIQKQSIAPNRYSKWLKIEVRIVDSLLSVMAQTRCSLLRSELDCSIFIISRSCSDPSLPLKAGLAKPAQRSQDPSNRTSTSASLP